MPRPRWWIIAGFVGACAEAAGCSSSACLDPQPEPPRCSTEGMPVAPATGGSNTAGTGTGGGSGSSGSTATGGGGPAGSGGAPGTVGSGGMSGDTTDVSDASLAGDTSGTGADGGHADASLDTAVPDAAFPLDANSDVAPDGGFEPDGGTENGDGAPADRIPGDGGAIAQ